MDNRVAILPEGTPQLAALECAASCLVAAIAGRGLDPRYFLLGYWHLGYFDGLLMSARNMKWIDLSYAYGIRTGIVSGPAEELEALTDEDGAAVVFCRASRLPFFPASMLGFESAGFYHCVLVHGRSEGNEGLRIADPVAGFFGTLPASQLVAASTRPGQLVYCRLQFDGAYRPPVPEAVFRRAADHNLAAYRKTARKAFAQFGADALNSPEWEESRRRTWAGRSAIAVSAIVRMRALVWQSCRELAPLSDGEREEGDRLSSEVARCWTKLNLQLAKCGMRASAPDTAEAIRRALEPTRLAELALLEYMAAQAAKGGIRS